MNRVSICSDNRLPPIRHQSIIWTNAGILLICPLGTNVSEISNIQCFKRPVPGWLTCRSTKFQTMRWGWMLWGRSENGGGTFHCSESSWRRIVVFLNSKPDMQCERGRTVSKGHAGFEHNRDGYGTHRYFSWTHCLTKFSSQSWSVLEKGQKGIPIGHITHQLDCLVTYTIPSTMLPTHNNITIHLSSNIE